MAFFDQWSKRIVDGSNEVIGKAKDLSEVTKRNSMIADCEKKIQAMQLEIGKQYFQLYADNGAPELEPLVQEIWNQQKNIQQLTEEIKQIKGVSRCPYCGSENSIQAAFCSSCGKVLRTQPVAPVEKPMIFCSNCGNKIQADALFCNICGTKVGIREKPSELETAAEVYVQENVSDSNEQGMIPEMVMSASDDGLGVSHDAEAFSQTDESVKEAENERICPNCGTHVGDGYAFCPECGERLN